MSQEKSLLYSIITEKCPRCREGNMFPKGTLYSTKFAVMYKHCSCCGQSFEPEPGYYFGAMFISYAINTGIFLVALLILSQFIKELTVLMVAGVVVGVVVGFLPVIFRISRAIWINIFIRYEGPCSQIPKKG